MKKSEREQRKLFAKLGLEIVGERSGGRHTIVYLKRPDGTVFRRALIGSASDWRSMKNQEKQIMRELKKKE